MKCPNCGAQVDGDFCENCGTVIKVEETEAETQTNETDINDAVPNEEPATDTGFGGFKLAGQSPIAHTASDTSNPNSTINPYANAGASSNPYANANPYAGGNMSTAGGNMSNADGNMSNAPYNGPSISDSMQSYDYSTPTRKKHSSAMSSILILLIAAIIGLGFFGYNFFGRKNAEKCVDQFFTGLEDTDSSKITELVDTECVDAQDIQQLESVFATFKQYGVTYTIDYNITKTTKASDSLVGSMCASLYNDRSVQKKVKQAYVSTVTYTIHAEAYGQSQTETDTIKLLAYKKGGKWYLGCSVK